jgi:hypothetical protein
MFFMGDTQKQLVLEPLTKKEKRVKDKAFKKVQKQKERADKAFTKQQINSKGQKGT